MAKLPPPVEHQFKKGNKGKPKGTLNVKTRMIKALLRKVEFPNSSKRKIKGEERPKITGPMIDFMIDALIKQALKGNTKAFEILIDRTEGPIKLLNDDTNESDIIDTIQIKIIGPEGESIN